MTSKSTTLILNGDINAEMAGHVAYLLREHQINAAVEVGDLTSAANLTPTPDILATAVSIASVLTFLLKVWETWHDTRKKAPSIALKVGLEDQLKSFNAKGFEVVRIQEIAKPSSQRAEKIVVTLNDVPGKQTIVVETTSDYHVRVQRRKNA